MYNLPGENVPLTPEPQVRSSAHKSVALFVLGIIILGGGFGVYYWHQSEQRKEVVAPILTTEENTPAPSIKPILSSITKEEYLSYAQTPTPTKEENIECKYDGNNWVEYLECRENFYLNKHPEVNRKNGCLEFPLNNGENKRLCDKITENDSMVAYFFQGNIPNLGYYVLVQYYEGNSNLVINKSTGEEMRLWDKPLFSPSGNRFLTTSIDLEAQYNPNGFQVGERQGDSYVMTHEQRVADKKNSGYPEFGIADPVWVDENTFYFKKITLTMNPPYDNAEYAKYSLPPKFPDVTFVFPVEGSVLIEGETYKISWVGNDIQYAYPSNTGCLLSFWNEQAGGGTISASSGTDVCSVKSFSWKVPNILDLMNGGDSQHKVAPTDGYEIKFTIFAGEGVENAKEFKSGKFKIVPAR